MFGPEQDKKMATGTRRLAGMGVELAATLTVACLLGYWIDCKFNTSPVWLIICTILGLVGGLYNMIRQSVHELFPKNRRKDSRDKDKNEPKQKVDS